MRASPERGSVRHSLCRGHQGPDRGPPSPAGRPPYQACSHTGEVRCQWIQEARAAETLLLQHKLFQVRGDTFCFVPEQESAKLQPFDWLLVFVNKFLLGHSPCPFV